MTVSVGGSTVVGFSLTNTEIPAGSGVLTVMSFDGVTADTSELTLGMAGAVTSAAGFIYDTDASGSVVHTTDCAGDYYGSAVEDECGVCNGNGIADGACDCDGNVLDCNNECGGSAVEDSCGVCGGAGPDAGHDCDGNCIDSDTCGEVVLSFANATDSSVDVMYSSSVALGGFQFTVDGVSLTGVTSDVFDGLSVSNNLVLAFSFTGASLPAVKECLLH